MQVAQRGVAGAEVVDARARRRSAQPRSSSPPPPRRCSMIALSVISSCRLGAGDARSRAGSARCARRRSGCRNCLRRQVDAHRQRRAVRGTAAARRASCRQASRSTHQPIGTIRPVSSATGMNSSGETQAAPRMLPAHAAPRSRRSGRGRARRSAGSGRSNSPRSIARRRSVSSCSRRHRPVVHRPGRRPRAAPCRWPWRGTWRCRRRAGCPRAVVVASAPSGDADAGGDEDLVAARARTAAPASSWMRSATCDGVADVARCRRAGWRTRRRRAAPRCRPARRQASQPPGDARRAAGRRRVAEAVVDDLEAVEVEEQHGEV